MPLKLVNVVNQHWLIFWGEGDLIVKPLPTRHTVPKPEEAYKVGTVKAHLYDQNIYFIVSNCWQCLRLLTM